MVSLLDKTIIVSPPKEARTRVFEKIMSLLSVRMYKLKSPFICIFNQSNNQNPTDKLEFVHLGSPLTIDNDILSLNCVISNALDAIAMRWFEEDYRRNYRGRVRVRLIRRNNDFIIETTDNGVGIQKELFPMLFLKRIKGSKRKYPKSLGLLDGMGNGVLKCYGRTWVASLGGEIILDTVHKKNSSFQIIYHSDLDIKIVPSRKKRRGTKVQFVLPAFFA